MNSVSIHGNVALVGDGEQAELLDVSDPLSPRKLRSIEIGGGAKLLDESSALQGGLVSMDWGIYAFDLFHLTDPDEPRTIGRLLLSDSGIAGIADGLVLVISDRLEAHRVGQPSNPQRRSVHSFGDNQNLLWVGSNDMDFSGSLAVLVDEQEMGFYEFSNPDSPTRLGGVSRVALGTGNSGIAFAVDSIRKLAVVSGDSVTRMVDISDPAQPVPKGQIGFGAVQIAASGELVFLARYSGFPETPDLAIVEVSNSGEAVTLLSTFRLGNGWQDRTRVAAVNGSVAYIASEITFATVDIGNPRSPVLISRLELGEMNFEYGGQIVVSGDYAYMAAGYAGMLVIDVSDNRNLQLVGTLPGTAASVQPHGHASRGSFSHVSVVAEHAYLLDSHQGRLVVADVSDPALPTVAGRNTLFASENNSGSLFLTQQGVFVAFRHGNLDLAVFEHYRPELRFRPATVLPDGRLRLPLTGPIGQRVHVQRSANLRDWEDWQTVIFDGTTLELTDDPASAAQRFYRAVEADSNP